TDGFSVDGGPTLSPLDESFIGTIYPKGGPTGAAVPLTVGAAPRQAAIGQPGETDSYTFVVTHAARYLVETSGPTDMVMQVAGPDDPHRIIGDDNDSGYGKNARVTAELGGGVFVKLAGRGEPGTEVTSRIEARLLQRLRDDPAAAALRSSVPRLLAHAPGRIALELIGDARSLEQCWWDLDPPCIDERAL